MRLAAPYSCALGLLALSACKVEDILLVPPLPDGGSNGPVVPGLLALNLDPSSALLNDDGLPPAGSAIFHAIGSFEDGSRDISAEVEWRLEEPALGQLTLGVFSSAGVGGRSRIIASANDLSASAEVEVHVDAVWLVAGADPNDPLLFPADTSTDAVDDAALSFAYPSHEVMLPQNLGHLLLEWRADPSLDRFQVVAQSPLLRGRVQSRSSRVDIGHQIWSVLAATHAGSELQLVVRGVSSADPRRVVSSLPITVAFARAEVPGSVYYASSTLQAVMRARLDAPFATRVTASGGSSECAGCHALSRDGRKLAYVRKDKLRIVSLPDGATSFPTGGAQERSAGWASFSPDGTRLVYGDRGRLQLFDAVAGDLIGPITLPSGDYAAQPDWSPDGSFVVVAVAEPGAEDPDHTRDYEVRGTGLGVLPVMGDGSFGPMRVLLPSSGEHDTLAFPSVSPDSSWVAFVRTRDRSKDNRRSEIYVIRADGSAPEVSLARLNRRGGGHSNIRDVGDTMPVWAPSSRPELMWLAFSSTRAVGLEVTHDHDQLWMAAIDPSRLTPGDDASWSALWLPFQTLGEANHRPIWSANTDDGCALSRELCGNGLDDDCNGAIDDNCCTPQPEVCGNSADDDCDGVADEGCGCGVIEICNNGRDDDCDGSTDDQDPECDN